MHVIKSSVYSCALLLAVFPPGYSAPLADEQIIHQQESQQAREAQLTPAVPDVRLSPSVTSSGRIDFPAEMPCFPIWLVELQQRETLPHWLPLQKLANQAIGHCLGGKGINRLMSLLQNRLIRHGYVTTRVVAPEQDLNSGKLILTLLPGTLRHVKFTPHSGRYAALLNSFPAKVGALLDLRAIEQGLENFQRVPTVQASMEITPGEQPGESDILLDWKQSRMWRIGLSLDDSGNRSTGRYQGGVTLYADNPLRLSDTLYLNAGTSLHPRGEKGTHNYTAQYAVPLGYWMTSLTTSSNNAYQTIAGLNSDYRYRSKSDNLTVQLSRVLHRSGSQKTGMTYDLIMRESKNFLNDTQIDVQRRKTTAWKWGLHHRHFIYAATLDTGISYQQGTRWFGAIPASEESCGEATALSKILQMHARLGLPFVAGKQNFRYSMQYRRQISYTPLTPQDQFSIGSRWTVRGFDGDRTLSADNGWIVRNKLGWFTPLPGQQLYLSVDYGALSGHSNPYLLGHHLAGGAMGLRGVLSGVIYDAFTGIPLSKPDGFTTNPVTFSFNLHWQY